MHYSPFRHSPSDASTRRFVRLACLSHAASVRSEPGSNSSIEESVIIGPKAVIHLTIGSSTHVCMRECSSRPAETGRLCRFHGRNRLSDRPTQIADSRATVAFSRLLIHCSLVKEHRPNSTGPAIITAIVIFASRNLCNLQFAASDRGASVPQTRTRTTD